MSVVQLLQKMCYSVYCTMYNNGLLLPVVRTSDKKVSQSRLNMTLASMLILLQWFVSRIAVCDQRHLTHQQGVTLFQLNTIDYYGITSFYFYLWFHQPHSHLFILSKNTHSQTHAYLFQLNPSMLALDLWQLFLFSFDVI